MPGSEFGVRGLWDFLVFEAGLYGCRGPSLGLGLWDFWFWPVYTDAGVRVLVGGCEGFFGPVYTDAGVRVFDRYGSRSSLG